MKKNSNYGAGSISETASGWVVRRSRNVDGKRHRYYEGPYPTREEAESAQRRALPASVNGAITLEDWLTKWLDTRYARLVQTNPNKYDQYRKHVAVARKHLQYGLRLNETRTSHLDMLMNSFAASGMKPAYQRNIRSTLGLALKSAVAERLIETNPISDVVVESAPKEPLVILTRSDWSKFIEYLASKPEESRALGCLIIATTGMRAGEASALQWKDIDLRSATISIERNVKRLKKPSRVEVVPYLKTESSRRIVSIPDVAIDAIRAHRSMLKVPSISDHVVQRPSGGFLEPAGLLKWVQHKQYVAAGVPDVGLHGLRHTLASHLIWVCCTIR